MIGCTDIKAAIFATLEELDDKKKCISCSRCGRCLIEFEKIFEREIEKRASIASHLSIIKQTA